MIDPKSLRVGNYVAMGAKPTKIKAIRQRMIECEGAYMYLKDVEGEPLTAKILLKYGFDKINSNVPDLMESPSYDGQRQFRWDSIDGFAIQTVNSGFIWRLPHVIYLHQLQNLEFDLFNTETIIKF